MENNKKVILFQGDSITDAGRDKENDYANMGLGDGYVNMIAGELCAKHPEIDIINHGVSGNRIADMYGRWQEHTLNVKYDIMNVLCGVNDVGFGLRLGRGSDANRFEFVYDRMLYEALEANPEAKLILCQPFLFKKDIEGSGWDLEYHNDIYKNWNMWDEEIGKRTEVIKKLSKKYNTMYIPFGDILHEAEKEIGLDKLTFDCIHLMPAGNYILARTWLDYTKELFD